MSTGSMDTSRTFQETLVKPSSVIASSLKGSADGLSILSGGLMRYHSAPSSTFASLLEPDLYSANEAADLVQFLSQNALNDVASFGDGGLPLRPHHKEPRRIKDGQSQQVYSGQNDIIIRHNGRNTVIYEDHIGQGPLSAILEHAGEESGLSQPCQGNPAVSTSNGAINDSDNQYKSNLIRHSSLPTDFLSRLAMAGMSERPMVASEQVSSHLQASSQQGTSHIQSTSSGITDTVGGKVYVVTSGVSPRGVSVRKLLTDDGMPSEEEEYGALESELNQQCCLSRQSSSPAGLLSQLSLDEFAISTDKAATPSSQSLVHGGWREASMDFSVQKVATLGQRKRGREVDAKLIKCLPAADLLVDQSTSPRNHYSVVGAANGDVIDGVLCKSRAKRGCATHPRSIAERVRRTKISERIKRLQELVPNLDKQAHTADMLDEVVEYVKLLQRQVEELSNQSHVCNGTCQKEGNNSAET